MHEFVVWIIPANCAKFSKCFQPEPYLTWTYLEKGNKVPGIGQELLYVFLVGLFCQIFLLLIEFGVLKRIGGGISKLAVGRQQAAMDEDVIQENYRVHELVQTR